MSVLARLRQFGRGQRSSDRVPRRADVEAAIAEPTTIPPAEQGWIDRIEARREQLLGTTDMLGKDTTVAEVTGRASKGQPHAQMLLRLVRATRARKIVELGTCVGISGSYLAAGLRLNGGGRLITLEGSAARCSVASESFAEVGLDDLVEVRAGIFADTYPGALEAAAPIDFLYIDGHHREEPTIAYFNSAVPHLAPGALVLFDDIRWSDEMKRAWQTVRAFPGLAYDIDLGGMGLLCMSASR